MLGSRNEIKEKIFIILVRCVQQNIQEIKYESTQNLHEDENVTDLNKNKHH